MLNINKFNFIVVGIGSPLQEKYALEIVSFLKKNSYRGVILTCGGFITQTAISKRKNREFYPFWIDKLNLRWFYRCFKQPYVLKRIILNYPISFCMVWRNRFE